MEHLSVSEAQRLVLESVVAFGAEQVALEQSLGRVLAEEVRANRDQPPYDISAMDGYALRSADLSNIPATLQIIEDIKAGDMPSKTLAPGQCARIMTGAPLPQGADAVIRVEDTQAMDSSFLHTRDTLLAQPAACGSECEAAIRVSLRENLFDLVQINQAVRPGNDIRRRGENMFNGEVVLASDTEITPGVIGVLATVKRAQVQVYRRPRVAILSTGNELEGLDEPVDPDKIPDANSYALMAQAQGLGIEPVLLGIARDDPEELEYFLRRGLEYDVLLVSGGTSVGMHDYVRPAIEASGAQMLFWRVAMKPGHPLAFGKVGEKAIFGLPGNPVSSMVCFEHFVAPALRRMMGYARYYRRTIEARLTHNVKHQPGRTEFIRVILAKAEGGYTATSTGAQSSGMLLSMARADGLAVLPSECTGLAADSRVTVLLLDGTTFQDDAGFKE